MVTFWVCFCFKMHFQWSDHKWSVEMHYHFQLKLTSNASSVSTNIQISSRHFSYIITLSISFAGELKCSARRLLLRTVEKFKYFNAPKAQIVSEIMIRTPHNFHTTLYWKWMTSGLLFIGLHYTCIVVFFLTTSMWVFCELITKGFRPRFYLSLTTANSQKTDVNARCKC